MSASPAVAAPRPGARPERRLVVVSYLAHAPLSPRGVRTRALVERLSRDWEVELVAGPAPGASPRAGGAASAADGRPLARRALAHAHSRLLLDRYEPWARRRLRGWRPRAAAAVLVGFPFSPPALAARALTADGIPYVVDVGDPWALTARRPLVGGPALRRARRAERRLWAGAAGAVVTTRVQARALQGLFPALPVLVRPNGLDPADADGAGPRLLDAAVPGAAAGAPGVLRLAHFGDLSSARLDVGPVLERLAARGPWRAVELHQHGSDWTGELRRLRGVAVAFHEPRPWREVVALAGRYDLALVVGNRDPSQLPSKAIAYLQLPVPRLAVVERIPGDALAEYVAGRAGWATLPAAAEDPAALVERHVRRRWTPAELAAPEAESWEHVGDAVARFVLGVTGEVRVG
jgi:hypothetical protein